MNISEPLADVAELLSAMPTNASTKEDIKLIRTNLVQIQLIVSDLQAEIRNYNRKQNASSSDS